MINVSLYSLWKHLVEKTRALNPRQSGLMEGLTNSYLNDIYEKLQVATELHNSLFCFGFFLPLLLLLGVDVWLQV